MKVDGPKRQKVDGPIRLEVDGPIRLKVDGPIRLNVDGPIRLKVDGPKHESGRSKESKMDGPNRFEVGLLLIWARVTTNFGLG